METTYNYSGQEDLLHDTVAPPVAYAGFWLRFAAVVIDAIVYYAFFFVVALIFGLTMFNLDPANQPAMTGFEIFVRVCLSLGGLLYFVLMECSSWQATLGKKAVGIKVTDLDGHRISFARSLGRYLAKIISAIILLIGYFMAGFTEKKQALHDIIAGTLVVKS